MLFILTHISISMTLLGI